jgi:hypothetical protein
MFCTAQRVVKKFALRDSLVVGGFNGVTCLARACLNLNIQDQTSTCTLLIFVVDRPRWRSLLADMRRISQMTPTNMPMMIPHWNNSVLLAFEVGVAPRLLEEEEFKLCLLQLQLRF